MHEQSVRGTLGALRDQVNDGSITAKGEFVIIVAGTRVERASIALIDKLLREFSGKLPDKEVAKALARATGEKRNALYKRLLELAKPESS